MEGVSNSAKDLLSGAQCVATGCYHSLLGVLPVFHLVQQATLLTFLVMPKSDDSCSSVSFSMESFSVYVYLTLGILTFDYVFLPGVQHLAGRMYGLVISSPATESHLLQWLATFLHYLFTGLWVLPVFWISKPINVIWFQDIASAALNESQKLKKTKSQQQSSSQSVSQSISRFIADLLFSILLQLLFLLQVIHYSYKNN
ncbi:Etoposide-induced protein 2.4 homolog [Geodia barretti]|uniref:Etoposide-induced protein 2.4 homolog n=1 Tax=Geodia barretti TaxID=519541 RepID=A0AA35W2J6_GEOBA|nr:Etoposide-induced protein 2.4 homolog [Geodia barretti]